MNLYKITPAHFSQVEKESAEQAKALRALMVHAPGMDHVDLDSKGWEEYAYAYIEPRRNKNPSWQAAISYAKSKLSTIGGLRSTVLPVMERRATSCYGRMFKGDAEPCRALAYSTAGRFHYCDDCQCGERGEARLSQVGSTIDRPVFDDMATLKFGFPYLECPLRRDGFSPAPDPVASAREHERQKYLKLRKDRPAYGSTNHGKDAIPRVIALAPRFVVDFGCGGNEFVKELRRMGVDGLGVDFANENADALKPMHDTKLQTGIADVVTSFDALEHLLPDDVPLALAEMRRVGRANGRFVVSVSTVASKITVGGENLHQTIRPRAWWINAIRAAGGKVTGGLEGGYIEGVWT